MQIAPSHNKQSIGIFKAQKNNFAKHNEAHKNLPHAYKEKRVLSLDPIFPYAYQKKRV